VNIVVTVRRGARKTLTRRAHTKQPLPAAFVGPPVRRNICATTTTTNSSFYFLSLSLSLNPSLFLSLSPCSSLRFSLYSVRYVCRITAATEYEVAAVSYYVYTVFFGRPPNTRSANKWPHAERRKNTGHETQPKTGGPSCVDSRSVWWWRWF